MFPCLKYKSYLYVLHVQVLSQNVQLNSFQSQDYTLKVLTVGNSCSCYWQTLDWSFIILSSEACIHNMSACRNLSIKNWWVKLRVVITLKIYQFTTYKAFLPNHVLRVQNKSVGYYVSMFWHTFLKCYKNIQHLFILCFSIFLYRLCCVEQ